MSNVMSMKKLRNNPNYNGFDLSRKNLFTAKVGELLPVCTIECLPDDKFNLKHEHFTRTRRVNTAAYTRIREYYDWFFVPTNLLWNKFNTFVVQMGNNNQHARGILDTYTVGSRHPYFTNEQVRTYLGTMQNIGTEYQNAFGFNRGHNSAKLLDYLGYGTFYNVNQVIASTTDRRMVYVANASLNPFPLLAYQKIYSDYFRNSQWENAYAPAFNVDYMNGSTGMQLPISDLTTATGVDNMFDLRYCNWNQDYFMGLKPNSQYGAAASVNLSASSSLITGTPTSAEFQIFSGLSVANDTANVRVQPSTSLQSYPSRLQTYDNNSAQTSYVFALSDTGVRNLRTAMNLTSTGTIQSAFTILALRQMQAKQRWAEITQSVGQDYQSQVQAHWGKEVSDAYSEKCMWLGGTSSNLDIQGIDNTNLVDADSAAIRGKGIGTGQSSEKFTAPCHGYLMCIYHAVPILDYMISGVDKTCLKTLATDYAIPEMDKTGMVSVPIVELINGIDVTEAPGVTLNTLQNTLLGYAPLYYEYKTAYDRIVGGFRFNEEFRSWVAPLTWQYLTQYMIANQTGGTSKINYLFFKVNPSILNGIFDADAGSGVTNDQLFVNLAFDIKASRKLDYNGLPM